MTTVSFHPPSAYNFVWHLDFCKNLCTLYKRSLRKSSGYKVLISFPQILLVTSSPEIYGEFCWKCTQVGLNVKLSFLVHNRNVFAVVGNIPKYQTATDSEHCWKYIR